ncbi:hypothetical protein KKI24_31170, partial [bacterium]|nr:hypothetical protein [bacterium]
MYKSILVLEESTMVHDLFESALPKEYWDWQIGHESSPENYISKAKEMKPGIIFLSNQDQKNDYAIVKGIRASQTLKKIPILLLTVAKDKLDEKQLRALGVQGFLRKPFESATLMEQIELTLRNHSQKFEKNTRNELENIDIIDDELLGLLSGKTSSDITLDNLEEELDPTMQLHPIEAESMLLEDEDEMLGDEIEMPDEYEETAILVDETDELDELEQDRAETEAIEMELEEISLDFDEYSHESTDRFSAVQMSDDDEGLMEIAVTMEKHPPNKETLINVSRSSGIGIMEIKVIPYDAKQQDRTDTESRFGSDPDTGDMDTIEPDQAEAFNKLSVTYGDRSPNASPRNGSVVENIAASDGSGIPYTELAVDLFQPDEVIEIEHTEISDDLDDDFE